MWLLDKALRRLLRRGQLRVTDHRGRRFAYGAPDPELRPVAVRFADRRVPVEIARDPGLGAAETYMDGRLILEEGDILDLVTLIRRNNKWEEKSARARLPAPRGPAEEQSRPAELAPALPAQRRPPLRSRQRALRALPRRRHAI